MKCVQTSARHRVFTMSQAASALKTTEEKVCTLVECGDLKPCWPRSGTEAHRINYLFSKSDVEKYQDQFIDYSELIPSTRAAKILKENLARFKKKYVKTGRLKAIKFDHKLGRRYFLKADIEALVLTKANTVTAPEASKILGVSHALVFKWTKSGKLIPFSGPDIDGFSNYLYLRSEIERIRTLRCGV